MKFSGRRYFIGYNLFTVGDAASGYQLGLRGNTYYTNVGNSLQPNNGKKFSAHDKDQDSTWGVYNCARERHGGFWYSNCGDVNLNGKWGSYELNKGMNWKSVTGDRQSVTFSEFKLKLKYGDIW